MNNYCYDIGPIRPPSEAHSLLIRVNRNCPWNKCEFCPVYKNYKFERKPLEDVLSDIDKAAEFYGAYAVSIRTAFLQDANPLLMPTKELVDVLKRIKEKFVSIYRITAYARSHTLARKSVEELKELKSAGLTRIHTGLETGYGPLLEYVRKGATVEQMIEGGKKVIEAGMELSEYVMPGLGGRDMSTEHAKASAEVLNKINPNFIRLRSFIPIPGTPLYQKVWMEEFKTLSQIEIVEEIRIFIENLEGINSYVVSDHIANLLFDVEGKLPVEKDKMLAIIDKFLSFSKWDKENYIVGSKLGIYSRLSDMQDEAMRSKAEKVLREIRTTIIAPDEPIEDGLKSVLEGMI